MDGQVTGELTRPGLLALVGITHDDDQSIVVRMAEKTWQLRIFADEQTFLIGVRFLSRRRRRMSICTILRQVCASWWICWRRR